MHRKAESSPLETRSLGVLSELVSALAAQVAVVVYEKLRADRPQFLNPARIDQRWPEIMDLETAGKYMDRGPDAVRHLVRKKLLPRVALDSKIQIRKVDIDKVVAANVS